MKIEGLEDRRMMTFDPSGLEQEMLEMINRMRIDPAGELDELFLSTDPADPNYGVSPDSDVNIALNFFGTDIDEVISQWASLTAVAPLAWNEALYDASVLHNQEMIDANVQSHQLPGEDSLLVRTAAAGHTSTSSRSVGENVFAYTESVLHGHSGFVIDWGNTPNGIQDPPGHRDNIMDALWQEVGIAFATNTKTVSTDVGPLLVTQDFGFRGDFGDAMLVGVAFTDADGDDFYDDGEGEGGITISATDGTSTFTTTSLTAGGYQIQLPDGTYTVTASGGSLTGTVSVGTVVVSGENAKLDLETASATPVVTGISGVVFTDADEDGTIGESEALASGWTVYLDANDNGELDGGEVSTTTNASGEYSFSGLATGTYTVRRVLQYGFRSSVGTSESYSVSHTAGDSDGDNDFGNYREVIESGNTVLVFGTPNPDEFTWTQGTTHTVTVNGVEYTFDSATFDTFNLFGRDSDDTLNLNAGAADDTANIFIGTMTLSSDDYSIAGTNFEDVNIDMGDGTDVATMYDGANDDDMISHPTWGRLIGSNYDYYVENSERLNAFATAGGNDRAYIYDGPTNDRFTGRPDFSIMTSDTNEFYTYMVGFERNFAFSQNGGTDLAFFYDSEGDDNFFGRSTNVVMQDPAVTYFNYAEGFSRNFAYAFNGGFDSAFLTDGAADDNLFMEPQKARLLGKSFEYYNEAQQFERVFAYSDTGGNDDAFLTDSSGDDTLTAFFDHTIMVDASSTFRNYAARFETMTAAASQGGNDVATLHDSAGDDLFFGRPGYGYLSGDGFVNRVDDFEEVTANGTRGGTNTLNIDALDYAFSTVGTWI